LEEVREAFNLFDGAHAGRLGAREIRAAFRALGLEFSKDEVKRLLDDAGKEPGQDVTLDEFVKLARPRLADRDSPEEVRKIFKLFDEEGSGFISFKALKRVCQELGENLADDDVQEMIDEADRDGDGQVSFEDFQRVMRKRGGQGGALGDLDSDDD